MVPDPGEDRETSRVESARQAVRAVGNAFKVVRLYSPGHVLTAQALQAAKNAADAYLTQYGPLHLFFPAGGVAFDFHPAPYDDGLIVEFTRALRTASVRAVRFLSGVTTFEISELLQLLYLPVPQIQRGGGVGKLLRERGVQNVVIDDLAAPAVTDAGAGGLALVMEALSAASPKQVAERLARAAAGNVQAARRLLREIDRRVVTRSKADQVAAWKIIGHALTLVQPPWQAELYWMVVQSIAEPWAASVASQWPPEMIAGLVARAGGETRGEARRVADTLRALHKPLPRTPIPGGEFMVPDEAHQAGLALAAGGAAELRVQALRRLLEAIAVLDTPRFEECLELIERETVAVVEQDDYAALITILTGLSALADRHSDVRGELAHASLHHMITLGARDLLDRTLAQPVIPQHPFHQAMQGAPAETARLLLELAGEEERIHVRRQIVDLLITLTTDQAQLLVELLLDPRWHVARNAVTVLAGSDRPEIVPYLRAALAHEDIRVRKEALQALAQFHTPQAVELLIDALRRSDPQTREAAAHWLGVAGMPEAVPALAAVLEEPLHEQVEVKREVIRALGRIGTIEAATALTRVLAAGGFLYRRQLEELRQEATRALQHLREGGT